MKLAANPVCLNLNLKLNEISPTMLSSPALRMNTAQSSQLKIKNVFVKVQKNLKKKKISPSIDSFNALLIL